jgi:predicted DNA-binding WGR domain protein
MKTTMTRSVKGRVRYYTIEIIPNLFSEWMVIRTYGSIKKLKPTGVIREIYNDAEAAVASIELLISTKQKKGYISRCILKNG